MNNKKQSQKYLLTRKMVADFLNGADLAEEILHLYRPYILKASTITLDGSAYDESERFIDEDLFQNIQVNILTCLPGLKTRLIHHLDSQEPFSIRLKD